MADCVPDQPFAFLTGAGHPAFADLEGQVGMILGDVAQVVGDASPDILLGIIPQRLEDGDHRPGILEEVGDADRPRESRPGAFAAQSPHMRIGVLCPFQQPCQRPLRPSDEERAHGELRAEAAGQFVLSRHRGLEGIAPPVLRGVESVQRDKGHMGQVEEHRQSEPLGARQRRGEGAGEDGDGVVVDRWQMPPKDACQVFAAPKDRQRGQTLVGIALEPGGIEARMNEREVVGETLDGLAVEQLGQGTTLQDGPRRLRQARAGGGRRGRVRGPHGGHPDSATGIGQ